MKPKNNWKCRICGQVFKLKGMLINHLKDEFDDYTLNADTAVDQLEELGVDAYK